MPRRVIPPKSESRSPILQKRILRFVHLGIEGYQRQEWWSEWLKQSEESPQEYLQWQPEPVIFLFRDVDKCFQQLQFHHLLEYRSR